MKPIILLATVMLSLTAMALSAQSQVEHFGKLDAELVQDRTFTSYYVREYKPDSAEEKATLPASLKTSDQVFAGRLYLPLPEDVRILLVEPAQGAPFLYADLDRNGVWSAAERFSFPALTNKPKSGEASESYGKSYGEILLKLPLASGHYKYYPVSVRYPANATNASTPDAKDNKRVLEITKGAWARGVVEIEGRKTPVRYTFDLATEKVTPTSGLLGIDANGDGDVDANYFVSPESAYAAHDTAVFRVGERYVSTKDVHQESGSIVLKEHPSAEYQRIELREGGEVPDFSFTDFSGQTRQLSAFRGQYLLLDFWGTWCGPCLAEIPSLKAAYAKYHERGFEILGMDIERGEPVKDLEKAKSLVREKGMLWPQAMTESIKEITNKRFRVYLYPTVILLNPQGKIVSWESGAQGKGPLKLRGEELLTSLEKLLR